MTVNTREYWTARFETDWEEKKGREQTAFFAEIALRHLPAVLRDEIQAERLAICDYGCALGDALPVLAQAFPESPLTGIDFAESGVTRASALHPRFEFRRASSMAELGRSFDVVYCSNTLEHFEDASGPLRELAAAARRYLIVLVPFRERERIEEHFSTFDDASFPLRLGELQLAAVARVDTGRLTPSYWAGQQLLVVYGHPDAPALRRLDLSSVTATLDADIDAAGRERDATAADLGREREERRRAQASLEDALRVSASLRAERDGARATAADLGQELEAAVAEKRIVVEHLQAANAALARIYDSDFYRLATTYYRWRDRTRVAALVHGAARVLRKPRAALGEAMAAGRSGPRADAAHLGPSHRTKTPYDGVRYLKPIAVSVVDVDFAAGAAREPFTVVLTIKDEARGIEGFLASLEQQSARPQQVIIVDGGSTDRSVELVEAHRRGSRLDIVLLRAPGANIARGRNVGIAAARTELLVLTDAGCRLDADFCKNLVGCFDLHPDVDLASGVYVAGHGAADHLLPDFDRVDWSDFLPSARSLAVRKSLVEQVGGFPEYLPLTGEDTLFDVHYRRASRRWVFNRRSVVAWDAPADEAGALRVAYAYGKGDGESGLGDYRHAATVYELVRKHPYGDVDVRDPVYRALCLGYLEGRQRRSEIEIVRRGVPGVVLVLSACHFASPGNGDAETAAALIASGFKVAFVGAQPLQGRPRWFDLDYTLLELYAAGDFNWEELLARYAPYGDRLYALYPAYHPALGALVERLKAKTNNRLRFMQTAEAIREDVAKKPPLPLTAAVAAAVAAPGQPAVAPVTDGAAPAPVPLDPALAPALGRPPSTPVRASGSSSKETLASQEVTAGPLAPVVKFWRVSRRYGLAEAVRRSREKLGLAGRARAPRREEVPAGTDGDVSRHGSGRSYDIVSFPIMPWASRFQRSQQLLTRFAAHDTRVFRVDRGFVVDAAHAYQEKLVHQNIVQVTLPASRDLSIYTDALDAESLELMLQAFGAVRADWQIGNAVCVVELPFWYPLAKELRSRYGWQIVYDCMDEHEGFSTNEGQMVSKEAELAREASAVVVTSQYLQRKMAPLNPSLALVRNATDFEHFARSHSADPLRGVPHPIIGYYGAISEWFDQELLAHAAGRLQDCTFVLIGGNDARVNLEAIEKLPNVRLLGEKPYAELPGYLHAFDVCIIPFKLGKLMEATNPVKFYEYISAGKPVVSVMLPELFPYREHLYLADGRDDFVEKVSQALRERAPEVRERRVALARENTWEDRYAAFRGAVDALFPKISIVIVTYGNLELTKRCVASIYDRSQYPRFEVVLVDNASKDGTPEYLRALAAEKDNVKIVLNSENQGFAGGNNRGLAAADGEIVVLLNNDTVVTPGWLAKLSRYLKDPAVGMVGPATNMCGNESIIHVPYDLATRDGLEPFVRRYHALHPLPDAFDVDMLSMFCVALRREVMDAIGPLDERFRVGMFEDTDYAERLRRAGYRIISARDVFVHHDCKSSFGKLPNAEYHRIYDENRRKFEEKWGRQSQY